LFFENQETRQQDAGLIDDFGIYDLTICFWESRNKMAGCNIDRRFCDLRFVFGNQETRWQDVRLIDDFAIYDLFFRNQETRKKEAGIIFITMCHFELSP
jgi:hypothetical protein